MRDEMRGMGIEREKNGGVGKEREREWGMEDSKVPWI